MTQGRNQGTRRLAALVALGMLMLMSVAALPAGALVDKNPNAIPFGPGVCDDGREFGLSYTPTDPAPVGFVADTNTVGPAKSLTVIFPTSEDPLGDHVVIEVLYDRPGKGLDRNTVRCVFPFGDGVWLATEVIFNN